MAEEKEILENTVVLSGYKLASYALLIVTGFILTKILGPAMYGLYSALLLVLNFSRYAFISYFSAYYKKGSKMIGRGQQDRIAYLRSNTFYPALLLTLVVSVLVFAYSFFLPDKDASWGLRIVSLIILLQQLYYFYLIFLRTDKKFGLVGQVDFLFHVARLLFYMLLAIPFGVVGAVSGLLLSYVAGIGWGMYRNPYTVKADISAKESGKLFAYGLPPAILGLLGTVFTSIDKLMIIRFFDRTLLGFYSFAVLVLEVIVFVPVNIALIILPSQLESSSKARAKNIMLLPTLVISYLIPIVIGGAFIFTRPVLEFIFPDYLAAELPIYALAAGAFFISILGPLENNTVSLNKESRIIIIKIFVIIVSVLANWYAISGGYGLMGIALATTAVYFVYFMFLSAYTFRRNYGSRGYLYILEILLPAAYTALLIPVVRLLPGGFGYYQFAYSLIQYCVFLLLNIPLWYYLDRRTGFIRLLANHARFYIQKWF